MGDFIINFYYKHAPNLMPEVLIHSPFLLQYSLGKFICAYNNSLLVILQVELWNWWNLHRNQAVNTATRTIIPGLGNYLMHVVCWHIFNLRTTGH